MLAQFPSTELAVLAAIALSRRYAEVSPVTGHGQDLRIGVHLSDVAMAADGDLYGDGVNTAARIQEAAEPGQVVLSQDVWRQLRGRREFSFQHLGDRFLKGTGAISLYVANVETNVSKTSTSSTEKDNLPAKMQKQAICSVGVLPFADLSAEQLHMDFGFMTLFDYT